MTWHSLYVRSEDSSAVAEILLNSLGGLGYKPYDPFPGGLGTPPELKTFIKHFVAPAKDRWVRVLGEADQAVIELVSQKFAVLHAWLTDTNSAIDAYSDGKLDALGLVRHLLPNKSAEDLDKAQTGLFPVIVEKTPTTDPQVILLPPEMAQMMNEHNVQPEQASNMISRLTAQLFNKMDKGLGGEASRMQVQAQSMLAKAQGVNWNSPAGQKLRSVASLLILPASWRDPDFDTVREAYQVARRLQRNASAHLMPDEESAIKALPDTLSYQPVYVGK
jgi:hypothetical protein